MSDAPPPVTKTLVPTPRRASRLLLALVLLGLVVAGWAGVSLARTASSAVGSFVRGTPAHVSQEFVMERLRDVAKLVASEMTLRDVIIYEQTRFRSTKRALLVATGRVSAGINLRAATIQIDSGARRIIVTLPKAQVLAVEVTNVTTYDESAGLLNPFTPDDRDEIQRRIRAQLTTTARQSGLLDHADRAAAQALRDFLRIEGYSVEVKRPLALGRPTG